MLSSDRIELAVLRKLCIWSGSDYARWVQSKLDRSLFKDYLESSVDPSRYSGVFDFSVDYLLNSFLRKWRGFDALCDRRSVALAGWEACEVSCSAANVRVVRPCPDNPDVEAVILMAQRKVADVLGTCNRSELLSRCRWSGGATFDLRRGASLAIKHSQPLSATRSAVDMIAEILKHDPHWMAALSGHEVVGRFSPLPNNLFEVPGNRFLTVPKTALTDRCICAEPSANAFMQQGAGQYIRRRLKRFGVDLDDQSRNKELAARAHLTGLATVDLSCASDSISIEVVSLLLPLDWFLYLDALRSKSTRVDGEWRRISKFSSMGNAYTFELESLLFWALAKSVVAVSCKSGTVSVYGDDIIIPASAYGLLVEVFTFLGFQINQKKSFASGHFFESCGGHYFDGVDVTPVFQKSDCSGRPEELVRLHNRLWRWCERAIGYIPDEFRDIFNLILSEWRKTDDRVPRIPYGCTDDDGFLSPRADLGVYHTSHGFMCDLYVISPRFRKRTREAALLAYKLRQPGFSNVFPSGHAGEVDSTKSNYRHVSGWRHESATNML